MRIAVEAFFQGDRAKVLVADRDWPRSPLPLFPCPFGALDMETNEGPGCLADGVGSTMQRIHLRCKVEFPRA
jgi:hypothetical protein